MLAIESLVGGAGGDVFNGIQNGLAIDGSTGVDTLSLSALDGPGLINLNTGRVTTSGSTMSLSGIESAVGTKGADTFVGDASDNLFQGGAGTDTADYDVAARAVVFTLGSDSAVTVVGASTFANIGTDTLQSIENLQGSEPKGGRHDGGGGHAHIAAVEFVDRQRALLLHR